jgi:protein-S-isoprenylcysteine O-methyltransferase Ste14
VGSENESSIARFQTARRLILSILIIIACAVLVFGGSLQDELMHEQIESFGQALILIGIGGRLWATLYIGGRKSAEVVSTGPYSITRNPLYLFSTVAAAGVGAQTGSFVIACLFMALCWAAFQLVAMREERFLTASLGKEYLAYLGRVPRFLPNPLLYRDDAEVTFQTGRFRSTLLDGLVFLASIPFFEAIESAQEAGVIPVLFALH